MIIIITVCIIFFWAANLDICWGQVGWATFKLATLFRETSDKASEREKSNAQAYFSSPLL